MSCGVCSETTRLIGIYAASLLAWVEVRGKPSRMKEAVGALERESADCAGVEVVSGVDGEGEEAGSTVEREEPLSQPLVLSSLRMRERMAASGTRPPELMIFSTSRPRGC